ncbi:MAG: hypothetical protein IMF17_07665 [Proteobacteria bacterium]|nr:hypothetical protein [Pseudomonadota bacterium]
MAEGLLTENLEEPIAPVVGQYDFSANQPAAYDPVQPQVTQAAPAPAPVATQPSSYDPYVAPERKAPFQGSEYNPYSAERVATGTGSYDYTQGQVDPNSLVENRLTGLLKSDSEYMQSAETGAKQTANKSGLLNTSIAAGAGRKAAIDASLPIAQQDASTYGEMTQANLGYATEADRVNSERALALETENVRQANEIARTNALAQQDTSKFNTGLLTEDLQFYAGLESDAAKTNALAAQDTSQFNTQIQSTEGIFDETQRAQIDQFNKTALNDAATNYANAQNEQNFTILESSVSAQLANIDAKLQGDLLTMEQAFLADRNMDSINGAIYQEMIQSIAEIIANSDADPHTGLPIEIQSLMTSVGATYDFIGETGITDVSEEINLPGEEGGLEITPVPTAENTPKPDEINNYRWDDTKKEWVKMQPLPSDDPGGTK